MKRIEKSNTGCEDIKSRYADGIWHRKMCHRNNETRKTKNDGRNRTTKSRKNQNTWREKNLYILKNIEIWLHLTSGDERRIYKQYLRRTRIKTCGVLGLEGQALRARLCCRKISDSIFWLYYFTPRWLTGAMPCPRKSLKKYTKRKHRADKRRKRFFYTFLYLLGSTTIPWMREFFLNTLIWLNPTVMVSKIR